MRFIIALTLALLLLPLSLASPNEASGVVSGVVDGDTIDVDGVGRIRLADIDCREMSTLEGPVAKQFTTTWLESNHVTLDIDDKRRTDSYGRIVAVVYLVKPDGSVENFNRKLVDEGQACIWDFSDNEFSPADWWNGTIPAAACIKSDSSGSASAWPGTDQVVTAGKDDLIFTATQGTSTPASTLSASDGPFVGSAKSDKYHYPSCSAAKRIKSSNLVTFSSSADARASGYSPCGICHPP